MMEYIDKYVWYQEGPGVRKQQYTSQGIKLLNVANLVDGKIDLSTSHRYISKKEAQTKYKHFLVDEGDLIIASSGIQVDYFDRKMGFAQKEHLPLCMNTSTIRFKVLKPKVTNIKYFMWFLKSSLFKMQLSRLITGSAQLNFGPSHLKKIKIDMPIKSEQDNIVNKLDKVQEIIDLRKKQIEKLDDLIKSKFVEMFGNPILNEKKWKVIRLKDLSNKVMSGNTPKGGEKSYVKNGIAFYRSQNVWKNKLELDDIVYIDEETHNRMKKSSLKHNDLLITKTGRINTENSSLGRTARYEGEDDKANINGHVYLVRLNKDVNNEFILRILISDAYREHIRSVCVGGIDKRQLNKEHIENFPIIYPPAVLQNKFVEFVKKIEKQKFITEKSLEETEKLRESLMNKYFG